MDACAHVHSLDYHTGRCPLTFSFIIPSMDDRGTLRGGPHGTDARRADAFSRLLGEGLETAGVVRKGQGGSFFPGLVAAYATSVATALAKNSNATFEDLVEAMVEAGGEYATARGIPHVYRLMAHGGDFWTLWDQVFTGVGIRYKSC